MAAPLYAVQQAIFTVLTGDSTLSGKVQGVLDNVPDEQAFPYIVIGAAVATPDDTHDHEGWQIVCPIDTWSQARGNKEVESIQADLDRLLHHQVLPVSGATWIYSRCDYAEPIRDPDGITRHMNARYRIWVQVP